MAKGFGKVQPVDRLKGPQGAFVLVTLRVDCLTEATGREHQQEQCHVVE